VGRPRDDALPSKYVIVDDVAVHYVHSGPTTLPDVPPVLDRGQLFILVHAAGGNAGQWRRQVEAWAGRHSVVALDLPGHGRSSGVLGLPTVEAYAAFLARFAAALRLRPAVVVGVDMGAAVALVLAARSPERVRALVAACAGPRFSPPADHVAALHDVVRGRRPQQFATTAFSPATGMEIAREAWIEQVKTDPRVRYTDTLACLAFDAAAVLPAIRTPTLVIGGADDQLTPPALVEELAGGIAGARLEVLAAAGHQAPLEQAEAFNALVQRFAEGLG
jgi:pimeloyl-ACP methyl ester carboxylesterase